MAARSEAARGRRSSARAETFAALLRDGATLAHVTPEQRAAVDALVGLGLVAATTATYVRCADPRDRDFPPKNRHCRGRLAVPDGLDEPGHDYRCPECERPVFPTRYEKRRHTELRIEIRAGGVVAYVRGELAKLKANVKDVAPGVLRADVGDVGVIVCVLECCTAERYLARDWASEHPTCYVAIDAARAAEQFLPDAWIRRVALADVVAGAVDLAATVREMAEAGPPSSVVKASVPVVSRTVPTILAEQPTPYSPSRRFVVECGTKSVRIDGVEVVTQQATTGLHVFAILWERFLEDMRAAKPTEAFRRLRLKDLVTALEPRTGEGVEDETSVRRAVNRLQDGIAEAVRRKLGDAIDREDIIETDRRAGQMDEDFGYRINPRTVCARPFQGPPA